MRIASSQLSSHLTQGLKPVYTLVGNEPLALRESLDAIRAAARKLGFDERTSFTVERNFNWQQITEFGQSLSLFASQRLLELNIPNGKPGVEGGQMLQTIVSNPLPDTVVVIMLPEIDWRDQKSAWYMALEQQSMLIPLVEVDPGLLPQWINQRLAAQKQSTDAETLEFVANQVEGNLLAAHQEIQKLALLFPEGPIDGQAVRDAVLNVSRFDAFQLSEAVLSGDVHRTVRILQGLQDEGEQPIAVMNPLLWAIRPLVKIKQAESRGVAQSAALQEAKLFGERQTLAKRALGRLSLRQLQAALSKLADIDKTAKGVMQGDAWLEIHRLCFGLAKVQPRARAR